MGVKSTVELTRREAEERLIEDMLRLQREGFRTWVSNLANADLEHLLEVQNDLAHNGEGYENYLIIHEA